MMAARRARPPASASRPASPDSRLVDLTRRLGAIANELDLAEIEVESGEVRVRVHRAGTSHAAVAASAAPPTAVTAAAPAATDSARGGDDVKGVTIDAPMVGTFYRASSPTAEPYVREGDMVKEGQIVCIIEAMKLMNEIESRTAGRIVKILVDNAQAVEYGQPLFIIEPSR